MYNLPFTGNLLHDVAGELITNTASGVPRLNFRIAINEGERGTDKEKMHPVPFTAFGDVAENLAASAKKGMRLSVVARLNTYKKAVQIAGEDKEIDMIGFTATEVGPSLRWATADVTKNAKKGGGGASSDGFAPEPAAAAAAPAAAAPVAAAAKAAPAKPVAAVVADDADF